ncbi:MAG: TIGR03564 family F420-dependent LLM class oxidoreductase [Acidimicrobiia bacterium]
MRIGLFISETSPRGSSIDDVVERAQWAEDNGLDSGWVPHVPWSLDALTALTIAGRATSRIELGTAVVPTWSHHPYGLAQHALSTQAACGGRLTLGIGPSHRSVAENWYGADYDGVIEHMREYLAVLEAANAAQAEALATDGGPGRMGGVVVHEGDRYPVRSILDVPGATPMSIVLAALAPLMLRLAGERADGTITWMGDEHTHRTHVVPRLRAAAEAVGRPMPRVIAGLPVAVCDDRAKGVETAERRYGMYRQIPTYARMLARGESGAPSGVAVLGTEDEVIERLASYADAGVTDLAAMCFAVGDDEAERAESARRTRDVLVRAAKNGG